MTKPLSYRYATLEKVWLGVALIVLTAGIWLQRRKPVFQNWAWQSLLRVGSRGPEAHGLKAEQNHGEKSPKIRITELTNSAEPLLIPLYMRAVDSQMPRSGLHDAKAFEIVGQIDYDFSRIKARALSQEGVVGEL